MASKKTRIAYLKRMIARVEREIARLESSIREGRADSTQTPLAIRLAQDDLRKLRVELQDLERS